MRSDAVWVGIIVIGVILFSILICHNDLKNDIYEIKKRIVIIETVMIVNGQMPESFAKENK